MAFLRTVLAGLLTVLAGLVGLCVLAILVFGWGWLRDPVETRASAALDRSVSVAGLFTFTWEWDLSPRLHTSGIRVGPAAFETTTEDMVEINTLSTDINLVALLFGRLKLSELEARGVQVRLWESVGGEANWRFGSSGSGGRLDIDGLTLPDARIIYRSELLEIDFAGRLDQIAGGDRTRLDGAGMARDQAFDASISLGPVERLFGGLSNYPVTAEIASESVYARFEGVMRPSADLRLAGDLAFSGDSLARMYAFTGIPAPATPPFSLESRLQRTATSWEMTALAGQVGDSDLAGEIVFERAEKKGRFEARLTSRILDFDDIGAIFGLPVDTSETSNAALDQRAADFAASSRVFPDAPLALERISRVDGQLSYHADRITGLGSDRLGELDLELTLENRELRLTPLAVNSGEGRLELYATTYASVSPPTSDIILTLDQVPLGHIIPNDHLNGALDARLDLSGSGISIRETLATANGTFRAIINNGQIAASTVELIGLDILSLLTTGANTERAVCAVADLRIEDGLARIETLLAHTDTTVIRGSGHLNLANETLDLQLEANDDQFNIGTIGGPVHVAGTLRDPETGIGSETVVRGLAGLVLGAALSPAAAVLATLEADPPESSACHATIDLAVGD